MPPAADWAREGALVFWVSIGKVGFLGGQALALGWQSRRGPKSFSGCVALSVEVLRARKTS